MSTLLIIVGVITLTFTVTVAARTSFIIVHPNEVGLLMVLGVYKRKLRPGVNIVPPFISMVHHINMQDQIVHFKIDKLITQDDEKLNIDGFLILKVKDPEKAFFEVSDYKKATKKSAVQKFSNLSGQLEYSDFIHKKEGIQEHIKNILQKEVKDWGLKVKSVGMESVERIQYS